MLKARIWIVDADENDNFDEVYANFDMLPTDMWAESTFSEPEVEHYRFSFVFTKLKKNKKSNRKE